MICYVYVIHKQMASQNITMEWVQIKLLVNRAKNNTHDSGDDCLHRESRALCLFYKSTKYSLGTLIILIPSWCPCSFNYYACFS